ncbi:WG repeat-containing protein [Moraxella bovis]|uniref:WG repeat-containing protein n=1 Tax=Moraxella bovis TaxID=476 RepID=UPI00319E45EF
MIAVAKDDKWGFVNKDNKIIIPFYYDKAYEFENDKAKVELNGETFILTNRVIVCLNALTALSLIKRLFSLKFLQQFPNFAPKSAIIPHLFLQLTE